MKLTIFNGGRGAKNLITEAVNTPNINVFSIVNAYDDGKSTGEIRKYFKMLGPSDIRKTQKFFLDKNHSNYQVFCKLFDFRLPYKIKYSDAIYLIENFFIINRYEYNLSAKVIKKLNLFLQIFLIEIKKKDKRSKKKFNFEDCSIINCIYGGAYIYFKNNLIKSINIINNIFGIKHNIFPNSLENLKLMAILMNGLLLSDESEIVNLRSNVKIKKIFLVDYYSNIKTSRLSNLNLKSKIEYLESISVLPPIYSKTKKILKNSNLIIFAPGTQHSSLLPTYLTNDIANILVNNKNSLKVFISNIGADYENPVYIVSEYIKNAVKYLNYSSNSDYEPKDLFDLLLINMPKLKKNNYVCFDQEEVVKFGIKFIVKNFEDSSNLGTHNGKLLLNTILNYYKKKFENTSSNNYI